jgi:hypothetical protein
MSGHKYGWANPGPAGLVALAMACFTFYALLTGKVDGTCMALMGIWLLGGFVIQIVVGVMELLEGNTTGGNVFTFFSAFFMLVTGLEMILKYFASINGWAMDARIDGWAWLPLAISLFIWTPAYFKSPLSLLCVVLALDVAVPIVAFKDMAVLTAPWAGPTAGTFLLIAGIFGLWTAAGIVLNTAYGRAVLPLGAPLVKETPSASAHG